MNHVKTTGIVIARVSYGEADRIVTMLTPDHGKISLMVKGARRAKSRLAGGVELFSISEIVFMAGKSSLHTLVSARLEEHFAKITADITRTMFGYEVLKIINKITEEDAETAYYELLGGTLVGLNTLSIPVELVRVWFDAQLLMVTGHMPNFTTDRTGKKLSPDETYMFDFDSMSLSRAENGVYGPAEIKFCRLLLGPHKPASLASIVGVSSLVNTVGPTFASARTFYLPT